MTLPSLCTATTRAGAPCKTAARPGSPYCFAHDASLAERRRAGNALGGHRGRKHEPKPVEPVRLSSLEDAVAVLERALGEAFSLEPSPQKTRAIVAVVESFRAHQEVARLAQQLEQGGNEVWRVELHIPKPNTDPLLVTSPGASVGTLQKTQAPQRWRAEEPEVSIPGECVRPSEALSQSNYVSA